MAMWRCESGPSRGVVRCEGESVESRRHSQTCPIQVVYYTSLKEFVRSKHSFFSCKRGEIVVFHAARLSHVTIDESVGCKGRQGDAWMSQYRRLLCGETMQMARQ